MSLKAKLEDAGPEVVTKLSEERNAAESRLRLSNRTVSELENATAEMKEKLDQVAEENIKVL